MAEFLKKYKIILFTIILPILCFISRKIYKPSYSIPLIELNENSYFGNAEIKLRNNTTLKELLNIYEYNLTRMFIRTKYNKIILYFTLSKYIYYDDYNISFDINLNLNKPDLIIDNSSISFQTNFVNNSNIIKIKNNKQSIINIFNKKDNIRLNNIFFKVIKDNKNIEIELLFDEFDLIVNLHPEKLTFKFYYFVHCLIDLLFVIGLIVIHVRLWNYNYQNINILFIYIIWAKITSSFFIHLIDLFKIGIPILKLLLFYFHLLIYGEFLLTFSDLAVGILTFLFIIYLYISTDLLFELEKNYHYCFGNKMMNNKIVIDKKKEKSNNYPLHSFIFILFISVSCTNSLYIKSFPLLVIMFISILKHLNKREVMCKKDNKFCITFYSFSTVIYSYYLLFFNFGEFYRIKPTHAILPFILILGLYIILILVIKNEYKFKSAMKKDFERIKLLNNECCSICLREFVYDKEKIDKYFCKVNEYDNIHETKCKHYFHEKCLFIWRKHRNICPICKTPLQIPDYYFFYVETPCIYKPSWIS